MSDNNYESDDDSWCYSIGAASDLSEPRLISVDDDILNTSLSTSSVRSSPSSSIITDDDYNDDDDDDDYNDDDDDDDDDYNDDDDDDDDDDDAGMMDIEEDDGDTSDTSTPLDETEYEMDDISDDEIIVLSDGDDIMGTVAHSRPPATFNGPMSTSSASRSTNSKCTEEETAACCQPSPTFNRPMSMLSTFSSTTSTCTEDETVTASSESNGEENFHSSSIKNYLPPCLSSHKLCFDNGIEVDRILGAVVHNTQLLFRVRWRSDKNGGTDYVDALEMHERCPHMALQFYNEHYKNKNTDK